MRYRVISCEVFARLVFLAAAKSQNTIDVEFGKLRSHVRPDLLRKEIQHIIDNTSEQYDAVLLAYGLCGNSTAGLKAGVQPLVIPRAHDCCTLFLGSRKSFLEHFGQTPSAIWYTACYYERTGDWQMDAAAGIMSLDRSNAYEDLAEKYGEENARYVWDMLGKSNGIDFLTYIDLPGFENSGNRNAFIKHASEAGKKTRFITGSTRLIDNLINGFWSEDEFLVVPPGELIKPVYDHDRIIISDKFQNN